MVPVGIDHLSRQFPGLVFNVIQAPTVNLQSRDLRERRVDLILGRMVTPVADEDLNAEALFDDPLHVVAGANSNWLRRRRIDPNDLINEPWSLPPYDSFVGSRIVDIFRAIGLPPPRHTVISTSIQLFNALVVTGRFLAILSGSTLRFSGRRLGLKALPVDLPIQSGPGWDRDFEEPNAQPRRGTIHRARSKNCNAASEAKISIRHTIASEVGS